MVGKAQTLGVRLTKRLSKVNYILKFKCGKHIILRLT
jgi:hypothetical protein